MFHMTEPTIRSEDLHLLDSYIMCHFTMKVIGNMCNNKHILQTLCFYCERSVYLHHCSSATFILKIRNEAVLESRRSSGG